MKNVLENKKVAPASAPDMETMVNDADREYTEANFPIGTVSHQGDLVLVRIESIPKTHTVRLNRQMAEGNTQGSRHILSVGEAYDCDQEQILEQIKKFCPKAKVSKQYVGPVFQTVAGSATLTHPEHGDHIYRGNMVIAVVIQRNLDAEEREQKARD